MDCAQSLAVAAAALVASLTMDDAAFATRVTHQAKALAEAATAQLSFERPAQAPWRACTPGKYGRM